MSAIKLAAFSGEQPRIIPRLLPPNGARSAVGARLDNGALTPYRAATLETTLAGSGPFQSIVKFGSEWLAFATRVNAAPGPVATDRLYYTGNGGVPKMRTGGTTYDLKVPAPSAAPTATPSGTGSGDVFSRAYVYTFVTDFGEESQPSPASAIISWQSGQTVTLSGIQAAPAGRAISKQRFYRSQTGSVGTDFYFIAERAASNANFVDTVAVDDFAEALPSRYFAPPPDDLAGLVAMPNGMMAAFSGKQLYFCEPFVPHAWPQQYVLTTDVPIVALAAAGSSLWVLTEGTPYLVSGTTPAAMTMEKVKANLPCVNARGVVDLGFAVAWPSNDGLAMARADGSIGLATANLFSPREWRKLNPGTMRAGQVQGRWIGSYNATNDNGEPIAGSLIVDLSGQSFLIRHPARADAWWFDIESGDAFYLVEGGNAIYRFDSADGAPEVLYWRSKEFVLPHPDTMGAILVERGTAISQADIDARNAEIAAAIAANQTLMTGADGIGGDIAGSAVADVSIAGDILLPIPVALGGSTTIGIYADQKLVATVTELDKVKRLPSGFKGRTWEIDVSSDIELVQITMAKTVDELKQAAAGPGAS